MDSEGEPVRIEIEAAEEADIEPAAVAERMTQCGARKAEEVRSLFPSLETRPGAAVLRLGHKGIGQVCDK